MLSKEERSWLLEALEGPLGKILGKLETDAQEMLANIVGMDLDKPEDLANAKSLQLTAKGYLQAVARVRDMCDAPDFD